MIHRVRLYFREFCEHQWAAGGEKNGVTLFRGYRASSDLVNDRRIVLSKYAEPLDGVGHPAQLRTF